VRQDFLRAVQRKVANAAIGVSALRGQHHPGLIRQVRGFLSDAQLAPLGVATPGLFADRLNELTEALRRALPVDVRHWGLARKAVNLFLRDAFYNVYLRGRFRLEASESLYEVPLDGVVAASLARRGVKRLPPWQGVKYLTPELSSAYQKVATEEAGHMGIARVHLDIYLWFERPVKRITGQRRATT
jgi:hypothetical protein